jgi:hypothetical protein
MILTFVDGSYTSKRKYKIIIINPQMKLQGNVRINIYIPTNGESSANKIVIINAIRNNER